MDDLTDGREDPPFLTQLAVFLPNRLGALMSMTRCLETLGLSLRAVNIIDAVDHAVARLLVDRPRLATEALQAEGYSVVQSDVLGVALPPNGVRQVLQALLLAELNVHYVYSLAAGSGSMEVLALHVEDPEAAARVLSEKGIELIGQDDLE